MAYRDIYQAAQSDPEGFWLGAAQAIDWDSPPTQALFPRGDHIYEWFADARVNTCYNAVDRHVEAGRGDQVAIIHDSPITGTTAKITYAELQTRVAALAGALSAKGVGKGDRVIIYMPRRSSQPLAGSSRGAPWITNRCLTERSSWPRTSPSSA